MKYTFVRVANNTTNGVALGAADQDIEVFKILIGLPVASGNVRLYDITNPVNNATTNMAVQLTLPASLPTTGARLVEMIDLTDGNGNGLIIGQGGNIMVDQAMQVTVLWDEADKT